VGRGDACFVCLNSAGCDLASRRSDAGSRLRGSEILVTSANTSADNSSPPLIIRVPVHGLIDGADPRLNIPLAGGEEIRVPEAAKIPPRDNFAVLFALCFLALSAKNQAFSSAKNGSTGHRGPAARARDGDSSI
jgi:hypothetical protein